MPDQMSKSDSARIQSSQQTGGHDMGSKGFAARAQAAGDRNNNASSGGNGAKSGNPGGQSTDSGNAKGTGGKGVQSGATE